jgi:hypothetical protein
MTVVVVHVESTSSTEVERGMKGGMLTGISTWHQTFAEPLQPMLRMVVEPSTKLVFGLLCAASGAKQAAMALKLE